eukprot:m.32181 g.32181  ORF g.32181 m.32181 type:complete len:322 (+) comp5483_c0_seq1:21-986(+)
MQASKARTVSMRLVMSSWSLTPLKRCHRRNSCRCSTASLICSCESVSRSRAWLRAFSRTRQPSRMPAYAAMMLSDVSSCATSESPWLRVTKRAPSDSNSDTGGFPSGISTVASPSVLRLPACRSTRLIRTDSARTTLSWKSQMSLSRSTSSERTCRTKSRSWKNRSQQGSLLCVRLKMTLNSVSKHSANSARSTSGWAVQASLGMIATNRRASERGSWPPLKAESRRWLSSFRNMDRCRSLSACSSRRRIGSEVVMEKIGVLLPSLRSRRRSVSRMARDAIMSRPPASRNSFLTASAADEVTRSISAQIPNASGSSCRRPL